MTTASAAMRLGFASVGVGIIVLAPGRALLDAPQLKPQPRMPMDRSVGDRRFPVATTGGPLIMPKTSTGTAVSAPATRDIDPAEEFFAELEALDMPWPDDVEEPAVDAAEFEAVQLGVLHTFSD